MKELKELITALTADDDVSEPVVGVGERRELSSAQMVSGFKRLFGDHIHLIDPALSLRASPITAGPMQTAGIFQYAQTIRQQCVDPSIISSLPGPIMLYKPVVMMLATSNSALAPAPQPKSLSWKTVVILPMNYHPPLGKPVGNNRHLRVYYFDTESKQLPNQIPREVAHFCMALSQGFQMPAIHQGRSGMAQVLPVLSALTLSNGSRVLSREALDSSWWAVYFAVMAVAEGGYDFDVQRSDHLTTARLQQLFGLAVVSGPDVAPSRLPDKKAEPSAAAVALLPEAKREAVSGLVKGVSALGVSDENPLFPAALSTLKKLWIEFSSQAKSARIAALDPDAVPPLQPSQMMRCLTQLLGDHVHLIDPALSLKASPLTSGGAQSAGVFNAMRAIRQVCSGQLSGQERLPLLKPVILILAAPGGGGAAPVFWRTMVILPQNYHPLEGKPLGNNKNPVFYYFDSTVRQAPNQVSAEVLRFCQALSQGCQLSAVINGRQGFVRAAPVFPALGFFNGSRAQCRTAAESGWWALYFAVMAVATGRYDLDKLRPEGFSVSHLLPMLEPLTTEKPAIAKPESESSEPVPMAKEESAEQKELVLAPEVGAAVSSAALKISEAGAQSLLMIAQKKEKRDHAQQEAEKTKLAPEPEDQSGCVLQ